MLAFKAGYLTLHVICTCASILASADIDTDNKTRTGKKLNVLFLMSDDMRPNLGAYSDSFTDPQTMHTPNIDKLASRSLLLTRAYVQQSVCSPSRTSLLTGRRPDTTRVHDLVQYWRKVAGNYTTLPQYFKSQGYRTIGIGKIFHPGSASGGNDPISWSEKFYTPDKKYWDERLTKSWLAADKEEIKQHALPDMDSANHAVEMLRNLSHSKTPFFLAVGFLKPHLPFLFPKEFLKYYPLSKISLPSNPYAPQNMPEIAWSNFDEIRKYSDIEYRYGYGSINTTLPNNVTIALRRAYYSSISYVDSLVGLILDELTRLNLTNETIVSFVGDHGWQLGEHAEWCKHTNFELATHAPALLSVPGLTDAGNKTDALVEFVDFFPTIIEAAGLEVPKICPKKSRKIELCREGSSFLPLLKNPAQTWKKAAFSQYPRMISSGDVTMGYTVRTDKYRYTAWVLYDTVKYKPIWKKSFSKSERGRPMEELYDHTIDPHENVNVVENKKYREVVKELRKLVKSGWRKSLPPVERH